MGNNKIIHHSINPDSQEATVARVNGEMSSRRLIMTDVCLLEQSRVPVRKAGGNSG